MAVALTLLIVQASRDSASPAVAQEAAGQLTATVSPEGCGTVTAQLTSDTSTPEPDTEWTFSNNAYVKVTAKAVKGCTFARWNLTLGGQPFWSSNWNPFQFQFISGLELTAHFTGEPDTTLTGITTSPSTLTLLEGDTATVTVSLDSDPSEAVDVVLTSDATTADLTFTPATLSWTAVGWQDSKTVTLTAVSDTTAEDPEVYTLKASAYLATDTDRAHSILPPVATQATVYDRVTLTTSVTGPGSLTPSGTTAHGKGQTVTLTASPNEGKYLRAWGGACATTSYDSETCELTLTADTTVNATFGDELPYTQLLVINDGGTGYLLLEWTGYPEATTNWQYRTREWRGQPLAWSAWTAIPGSTASTRNYKLTLAPGAYEIEVRGVGANGFEGEVSVNALDDPYDYLGSVGFVWAADEPRAMGPWDLVEGDGTTNWWVAGFTITIPDGRRIYARRAFEAACAVDTPDCATQGVPIVDYVTYSHLVFDLEGNEESRLVFEPSAPADDGGASGESGSAEAAMTVDDLFDQIVASVQKEAD